MTYSAYEQSVQSGQPIELYRFSVSDASAIGGVDVFGYCDADYPISHGGLIYLPKPMKRDKIKISGTIDKAALTITTTPSGAFIGALHASPFSAVVNLTIYRVQAQDRSNEARLWWTGRITNYAVKETVVTLTGEPDTTSLARPGLRRNYQYTCPHALYGPLCKAEKIDYLFTASAIGSGGTVVATPNAPGGPTVDTFVNGTVSWVPADGRQSVRWIAEANLSGADFVLSTTGLTSSIAVGQALKLNMGCPRTRDICNSRFNNVLNFGGFPWIPDANPTGSVSPFI